MSTSSSLLSKQSPIPPRGPELPTKIYFGGCHCGKFAFKCRHPVLEDGFEVVSCNCTICIQRGYLVIYIMDPKNDFELIKGEDTDLARYRFNTDVVAHVFCPSCGCGLFAEARTVVGVNLRAVADFSGLDLDSLTIKKYDGRSN